MLKIIIDSRLETFQLRKKEGNEPIGAIPITGFTARKGEKARDSNKETLWLDVSYPLTNTERELKAVKDLGEKLNKLLPGTQEEIEIGVREDGKGYAVFYSPNAYVVEFLDQ